MAERDTNVPLRRSQSPAAKLKRLAWIILMGGLALAGLIYVLAPQTPSFQDDPLLAEYYDMQDLTARRMWGNEGPLMVNLLESLKHARTYSVIVAVGSILGSFACFYLSLNAYDGGNEEHRKEIVD
jgi:hypothetical protein